MKTQPKEKTLPAGVYSAFVLIDDGTWTQPAFSIGAGRTEKQVIDKLTQWKGGFYVTGLLSDDDADDKCVTPLFDPPTVVVFRKFRERNALGDVIALFPLQDEGHGLCASYCHIGQHSAAAYDACIAMTDPASPEEYADLKEELLGIGYELDVRTRRPPWWFSYNVVRTKET